MNQDLQHLLYPKAKYHGSFSPEGLLFNANLQEFAQQVEYICGLYTGGSISSEEAILKIGTLFQSLVPGGNENSDDDKKR